MKAKILFLSLLLGIIIKMNAQNQVVNGTLTVKSSSDGIVNFQTLDDGWLYTQWKNSSGIRKAYVGFNSDLTNFIISLENGAKRFTIPNGNVGIGTYDPNGWKLAVNGKVRAKEVKVETAWSDFVFHKNYNLPTLVEVENHIKEKGHLKDIPSAKEVEKNGIFLGEMDAKLLQKIEELTLYTIEQEKQLKFQNSKIEKLEEENESLKSLKTKFLELQKRVEKLE
ncbi:MULTISPECIES: hypothetical protein [Mesonia]|uniref:Uncharacterized protein n=1 Tax=Mesonia oceanica TaxID=2687242 RepID=A0AC61Y7G0_9FLAO|nr:MULTISPECIES: hypothetical protein [Mesonia]MAN28193.1 hypothetical protein [Mesonia sp.]VVV00407.1 hypothetical protein FVB9532_01677 [Mesonia oceanica]|tara:strand:- start:686 stop:1357 length:672 start_codon:yes stop_codon:yes gene_type:complete